MSDELIDKYVERNSIKEDTEFLVQEISRAKSAFNDLSNTKINIEISKSFTDIASGGAQADKEFKALLKTQLEIAKVKRLQLENDNLELKNAKLLSDEAARKLKLEEELAKAKSTTGGRGGQSNAENDLENLKKTGEVVNDLDKAEAAAAISATEYGRANKGAAKASDEVKKSTHELNKEIELKKQLDKQAAQELKNTVREENAVKGSLEQRRAALIRLNAVYDNQSPAERASAAGQRLQRVLQGLDGQVKSLEAATGRAQRNVGNYGSAFDQVRQGASKAFGAIRTLANILPGIGISGLFLAAFEAIKSVINSTETLTEKQKLLNDVRKEGNKNAAEELTKVQLLYKGTQDLSLSIGERTKAAKFLQDTYPETFKNYTTEQILLGQAKTAYDDLTESILKNALAQAAKDELVKLGNESLDVNLEFQRKQTAILKEIEAAKITKTDEQLAKDFNLDTPNQIAAFKRNTEILLKAKREQLLQLQKDYGLQVKEIFGKQQEIIKFVGAENLIDQIIGAPKKGGVDSLQALKEVLDNSFKIYEVAQKAKIRQYEIDLDSDKTHFLDKITILQDYYNASLELINRQAKEESRLAIEKADREKKKLEEEKAGKSSSEIARINENIKIVERNLQQDLLLINAKADDKKIGLAQETANKKIKISEGHLKTEKDFLDQQVAYEEYTADQINKIRERTKRLTDEARNKEIELFKELQNKKIEAALAAEKFLFALGDATYQKQLNQIKQRQDEIDKEKEAALAANDARVQSEQDKAANIVIINQRAQTEKEKLDRRAKEVELKRAAFDRAQQAFEIGINTIKAIAEIKAKAATLAASGNPLIAALAAKALAQIPFVLATAAASLAALFVTPLPRLFRGKKRGQDVGDMAMVNDHPDGITKEVIERASGEFEFPVGRNVVTHVGKDDIVHPDRDAFVNAIIGAAHRDANSGMTVIAKKQDDVVGSQLVLQTRLLKQIASKKELHLGSTDRGMSALWKWGANSTKYIDENTNW